MNEVEKKRRQINSFEKFFCKWSVGERRAQEVKAFFAYSSIKSKRHVEFWAKIKNVEIFLLKKKVWPIFSLFLILFDINYLSHFFNIFNFLRFSDLLPNSKISAIHLIFCQTLRAQINSIRIRNFHKNILCTTFNESAWFRTSSQITWTFFFSVLIFWRAKKFWSKI